jgi:hypothetical protein
MDCSRSYVGVEHSLEFFNIVFFAVLLSTLLQGTTFEPLAAALGATSTEPALGPDPAPPRPALSTAIVATSGPWTGSGDPAYPREVGGVAVVEQLRTRVDRAGALVTLADGRYAFTGEIFGIGSASALQTLARRRLAHASSSAERA